MTEFRLHVACKQFLDMALPVNAVYFHTPNAPRSKVTGARLKAMGMKAGVPDICIIYRGDVLFVELKTAKGRLSPAQKDMQMQLASAGAHVMTECRSVEALEAYLEQFMLLRAKVAA
jgi:hypothetical protein